MILSRLKRDRLVENTSGYNFILNPSNNKNRNTLTTDAGCGRCWALVHLWQPHWFVSWCPVHHLWLGDATNL